MTGKTKKGTAPKTKMKKKTDHKICMSCPADKNVKMFADFYASWNPLHSDKLLPICKQCIRDSCYDAAKNDIDVERFKSILRQVDRPFIPHIYDSSKREYANKMAAAGKTDNDRSKIIGIYFRTINSMKFYKFLSWQEGIEELRKNITETKLPGVERPSEELPYYIDVQKNDKIRAMFGRGYEDEEYEAMWEKYEFLRKNYNDLTNLHTEALVSYVRYKVKEEFAIAKNNVADAKEWSKMASVAADKAKINPKQLSRNDLQGGINSFSELIQAVESAADVVPILPRFKYSPNDAVDFIIWCLTNYLRRLEDKPEVEYEDVYKFYDIRVADFIKKKPNLAYIFDEDPTVANRKAIEEFIRMPSDYYEEVMPEDDDE